MGSAEAKLPTNASDPIKELLDILGQFGSGTTTTRSSPEGGVSNQADALMQSILGSSNPDNMANLVQGILLKAKAGLGPNIASSIAAGNRTVSDSSLASIQSEAAAKATAESAQAVLEAQTNAQRIAGSIVNTKLNASRVQTQRTGITPAGRGVIGLALGQKARKAISGDETPAEAASKSPMPEQLGYTPEQLAAVSGPEQLGFSDQQLNDLGVSSDSASVTDVIPGSNTLDNPFVGDTSSGGTLDNPFVGDTGGSNSSSSSSSGSGSFLDNPFFSGAPPLNSDPTNPNDSGGGGVVDNSNNPPPDNGCFLCWIVCTELHRQGKLPTRWYIPGSRVFAKYDDNIKRGYYFWAIPLSKHLRKSPDSLLSKFTTIGCNHRAEFIANRAGIRGARKTLRGWLVIHSLYWACWFLGKVLPKHIQFTEESGYGRINS